MVRLIVVIAIVAVVVIVVIAIRDIIQIEGLSFLLNRNSAGLEAAGTSLPCGHCIPWLSRSGCGPRHVLEVEVEVGAASSAPGRF